MEKIELKEGITCTYEKGQFTIGGIVLDKPQAKLLHDFIHPKLRKVIVCDFDVAEEYADAFYTWLEYKAERKESYKTQRSMKCCYSKLLKLSNSNPSTALAIVEQSMANNWAGLFELKNESRYVNKTDANAAAFAAFAEAAQKLGGEVR